MNNYKSSSGILIGENLKIDFRSMVPGAGVEPARMFSPRDFKSLVSTNFTTWASGAGNEDRTRDSNLGKVMLYQLSYSRILVNAVNYT